jgi:branched-chain amino acid aminotransferase
MAQSVCRRHLGTWWGGKGRWLSSSLPESLSLPTVEDDTFRACDIEMKDLRYGRYGTREWKTRRDHVHGSLLDSLASQHTHGGLGFGKFFSDHMMSVQHTGGVWSKPVITPLQSVELHPASQVLHYGMSCFEGMKVYRHLGNGNQCIQFFRPELNMERLLKSARRLHLPSFCPRELLECITELVRMDEGWVPGKRGQSLYIRPVMYSLSDMLGVSSPQEVSLNVIMSPSGNYFGKDMNAPIRMYIEEEYKRAWPGGAGDAKVSGNYAPTIYPQAVAKKRFGADQVVFTTSDGSMFEECGAMNIFFVFRHADSRVEVATPPLLGTILPGVTRQSILEIVREWSRHEDGIFVSERSVGVDEVRRAARSGMLMDMFACGTASVVQPIGCLVRKDGEEIVPEQLSGAMTSRIYNALVDIQHGMYSSSRSSDVFDSWTVPMYM